MTVKTSPPQKIQNPLTRLSALTSVLLSTFLLGCDPTDPQNTPADNEARLKKIPSAECTKGSVAISAIQGEQDISPMNAQMLVTQGIVTEKRLGVDEGYFIQDASGDNNPNTPEGIFILGNPQSVSRGDWVRVAGKVRENDGMTQLLSEEVMLCEQNQTLPGSVTLTLPFDKQELETLEGMRVRVDNALITNTYTLARYGEVTLGTRLQRVPSDKAIPLSQEFAALTDKNREYNITLEDNLSSANPDGLSFLAEFGYNNRLKVGDYINAEGALYYHDHKFRISASQPELTQVLPQLERPLPEKEQGRLRIASFNLLNYFNGQHNSQGEVDFSRNARGATQQAGFELQEKRLVSAIRTIDADILGLLELENDGFEQHSAIQRLIAQLNQGQPEPKHYTFSKPSRGQSLGSDKITVGLLYRPNTLTLTKVDSVVMPTQSKAGTLRRMRPSLVADFRLPSGKTLQIAVNHFKSKGSACWEDLNQPSQQDVIQGRCNALRVSAAAVLGHALTKKSKGIDYQILLGDFNAYSFEDPIQLLTGYNKQFHPYPIQGATGVANAPKIPTTGFGFVAPAKNLDPNGFSYVYSGRAGSLDHILVNPKLARKITLLRHWNINSVETSGFRPDALFEHFNSDYHRQNYYQVGPFASSDHDPVIMDMQVK